MNELQDWMVNRHLVAKKVVYFPWEHPNRPGKVHIMKTLRKFPSWLPRKLENVVFALFALVWTASLGGCNPVGDDIQVLYGAPDVQDTLVAKYGTPPPSDTAVAKYGTPTPKDTLIFRYGSPTPVDTMKAWYGAPTPIDTVIAKYGIPGTPAVPDTSKTSYAPVQPDRDGPFGAGEA